MFVAGFGKGPAAETVWLLYIQFVFGENALIRPSAIIGQCCWIVVPLPVVAVCTLETDYNPFSNLFLIFFIAAATVMCFIFFFWRKVKLRYWQKMAKDMKKMWLSRHSQDNNQMTRIERQECIVCPSHLHTRGECIFRAKRQLLVLWMLKTSRMGIRKGNARNTNSKGRSQRTFFRGELCYSNKNHWSHSRLEDVVLSWIIKFSTTFLNKVAPIRRSVPLGFRRCGGFEKHRSRAIPSIAAHLIKFRSTIEF